MQVVPDGLPCECGQRGCWEQCSSGRAIARVGRAHGDLDGPAVTEAARRGEDWALEAFEDVGGWLGVGLAGLVSALDPQLVIVGGGLSAAGDSPGACPQGVLRPFARQGVPGGAADRFRRARPRRRVHRRCHARPRAHPVDDPREA